MSRRLAEERMGWVVPEGDEAALTAALAAVLESAELRSDFAERGLKWAAGQSWERVLAPLAEFLDAPRCDPHKHRYPPSSIPPRHPGGRSAKAPGASAVAAETQMTRAASGATGAGLTLSRALRVMPGSAVKLLRVHNETEPKEKSMQGRNLAVAGSVALVAVLGGASIASAAATELKGAEILKHACGKASVQQMGLVNSGKMAEAVKLGTAEMQAEWNAMPAEDHDADRHDEGDVVTSAGSRRTSRPAASGRRRRRDPDRQAGAQGTARAPAP
jgi:hypothetical protein